MKGAPMVTTRYSRKVPGAGGNFNWPVLFDLDSDGYLGISQDHDPGVDRVLLSPAQVRALQKFLKEEWREEEVPQ